MRTVLCSILLSSIPAWAQVPPSSAASAPSERAARDADKVYQMILQHADKPRRAATASATPAPAAVGSKPLDDAPAPTRLVSGDALTPGVAPAAEVAAVAAVAPETSLSAAAMPLVAGSDRLVLVSSVDPVYPPRLLRDVGRGSAVVVSLQVRADGTVARAEVTSSPHRGLNDAALAAVSAWRFKPIAAPASAVVELKFE